jgi:hypothetical protein
MDLSWSTVCKLADALGVSVEDFRGKAAGRQRGPKGKGREQVWRGEPA